MSKNIWMDNSQQGLLAQQNLLKGFDNIYNTQPKSSGWGTGGIMDMLQGFTEPIGGRVNFQDMSQFEPGTKAFADAQAANNIAMQNQAPSMMDVGFGAMNAYNLYNSWQMQDKQMGLMEEQFGIAKEQWQMTQDEIARIAKVRTTLNNSYQS